MAVSAAAVKELREKTGVGMMKCKEALKEAGGDLGAAEKLLRKQGEAQAEKKSGRATGEGLVSSYIHTGGKILFPVAAIALVVNSMVAKLLKSSADWDSIGCWYCCCAEYLPSWKG